MASSATISTRIEPLCKDNYETWKLHVEALLIKNDLWEYVSGEKPLPEEGETDSAASTRAKTDWIKTDRKARSDLILSIHPSELQHVRGCTTSREVWLKLESIYASRGPARKVMLLKQIMLQKLTENGDARDHINKFFDAVDRLAAMDVEIHKDVLSILLLYSLPASYENFRCAIESRDELPSADLLKVKILEESNARKQSGVVEIAGALAARNNGNRRRHGRNSEKNTERNNEKNTPSHVSRVKCFKCGKLGHKSPDCFTNNKKESANSSQDKKNLDKKSTKTADDTFAAYHADEEVFTGVASKPWILDSGCTAHLCGNQQFFKQINTSTSGKINLASQASSDIKGKGTVALSVANGNDIRWVEFLNTLFVPELRSNLVSVAKITDKDHDVLFRRDSAVIFDAKGNIKMTAERRGDLYYINERNNEANLVETKSQIETKRWHNRLGHLNSRDLLKIMEQVSNRKITMNDMRCLSQCDICMRGKMTALPFPTSKRQSDEPLQIVHSDVVGPFRTQAANGAKYFVTFVDDHSRWCEVFFLKQKSGVAEAFRLYQAHVERQTGRKIKCLQSDNGKEYCNDELDSILDNQGIERRLTVPRTPEQNGVAERMNRTLLDMARCLMIQSRLPLMFWAEAVATACHIRNRCPSSSLSGAIPYEMWTGKKTVWNYLRAFGSTVYVLDKDSTKGKFAARAVKGIFVGYPRETKGYRIWLPEAQKFLVSRDIKFQEEEIRESDNQKLTLLDDDLEEVEEEVEIEIVSKNHPSTPKESPRQYHTPVLRPIVAEEPRRGRGRPRILRTGCPGRPKRLFSSTRSDYEEPEAQIEDEEDDVFTGIVEVTLDEVMNSLESNEWKKAIQSEVESLVKNNTWEIVQKPPNQNVVGSRLVLTNKYRPDGSIERRKARIVAKGYSQKFGIDYNQTFAPVARMESIRLMLALAAEFGMKVRQFDVVTAYLNGILEEKVFMEVPEMLSEMLDRINQDEKVAQEVRQRAAEMLRKIKQGKNVCRLQKAIYGLRQAGRQWYNRLSKKLPSIGFNPTKGEPCMYHANRDGKLLLLIIYVDDILVASTDCAWIDEIKCKLLEEFDIKDLGEAKHCLGIEINQSKEGIMVSQTRYIQDILEKYGMNMCNPVKTPSELQTKGTEKPTCIKEGEWPYRELIGALMYIAVGTRPDIANTVSRLAQFVNEPNNQHWAAAKRVLRYLSGTKHIGLLYTRTNESIIGYSDADWGGCTADRRSFTGYDFILGGAAITWKSQKQRTVALSSTEAEYISLSEAIKEALHLRSLLREIGLEEISPVRLYVDNRGAQQLAQNSVYHSRTKHIDIRHHFVREVIEEGLVILEHIPTHEMAADIFTKALTKDLHWRCIGNLGLENSKEC